VLNHLLAANEPARRDLQFAGWNTGNCPFLTIGDGIDGNLLQSWYPFFAFFSGIRESAELKGQGSMSELPDDTGGRIEELSAEGDALAQNREYSAATPKYWAA